MKAKHIGIVACSAEGAALCYTTICVEGAALLGPHNHPEVSLHSHPLAAYMQCVYRNDWSGVADEAVRRGWRRIGILGTRYLVESDVYPEKLQARGLDFRRPREEERERIN